MCFEERGDGDARTTCFCNTGAVSLYQTIGPNGYLNYHSLTPAGALGADIYYAFDPQGNLALALDAIGNVTNSTIMDAYGTSVISGASTSSGTQWGGGYYNGGVTPYLLKARRYYDSLRPLPKPRSHRLRRRDQSVRLCRERSGE